MNPYVRVSYSEATQKWIPFAKHFERLASPLQRIINYFAKLPRWNYRRGETEGRVMRDRVWVSYNSTVAVDGGNGERGEGVEVEMEDVFAEEGEFGGEEGTWQGMVDRAFWRRGAGRGIQRRATISDLKDKEYWREEGRYVEMDRVAKRGGYCGVRQLLVVKENRAEGEGNWDNLLGMVPPLDV